MFPKPTSMLHFEKIKIHDIYTSSDHCFAISHKRELYAWGLNCKG